MKAPAFSYARPSRLADALALLEKHGDEARLLAGGQTLMATLNMRLSEPSLLIDLQSVAELRGMGVTATHLRIGAMVTHSDIESSALVAQHAPLLAMAAPHIAHRAIRNLGTFGGSIAYGDWKALFHSQLFRVLALLFLLSVYYHAWIGIRDVLMDYIKPAGIKLTVQVGVQLFLVACTIWSVSILWGN